MRPATADAGCGAGNETLMRVPSADLTARSECDCKRGRPMLDFGLNHDEDDEDEGEGNETRTGARLHSGRAWGTRGRPGGEADAALPPVQATAHRRGGAGARGDGGPNGGRL